MIEDAPVVFILAKAIYCDVFARDILGPLSVSLVHPCFLFFRFGPLEFYSFTKTARLLIFGNLFL